MIKEGNIDFVVENVNPTEEELRLTSAWIQQRKAEISAEKPASKKRDSKQHKELVHE